MLQIARAKAAKAGLEVSFEQGTAFDLHYRDNSFDRVISSLVFHHLTGQNKARTLREVFRALRPGGELHVADWGEPTNILMRGAFLLVQLLDGFKNTSDNVRGLLPEMFLEAGFLDLRRSGAFNTVFGTLRFYSARKPA